LGDKKTMFNLPVPYDIPYVCQFASPELVHTFVYGERDIETDPRWAESGAADAAEYAHWARRSCGVVCVKMAVEGIRGGGSQPVMAWVREGLSINGYLIELRADRPERPVEKGWKHASLAELAQRHGCSAALIRDVTAAGLAAQVKAGRVIIASVTSELGEDGEITRSSGHLVLVIGVTVGEAGNLAEIIIHNPSGRTAALQDRARIPVERFMRGFSGRGIAIGRG
jgi:hypothetical protein